MVRSKENNMEEKSLYRKSLSQKWFVPYNEIEIKPEDKIDSGSGGDIFRVNFRGLDCVAKRLRDDYKLQALKDLCNEIEILSTLRHPNLIQFLGAYVSESEDTTFPSPVLLMEYCDSGTLYKLLCKESGRGQRISKKLAMHIMFEISLAMNFLHSCNPKIIHRDLKPQNILLTNGGQHIKLADFGLAKALNEADSEECENYVMTGETGSYRFMAPEVYKHEKYDEKVDVYSFAVISYWILAGNMPYLGIPEGVDVARKVSEKKTELSTSGIKNKNLADMLSKCWSYDSSERLSFSDVLSIVKEEKTKTDSSMFSRFL